MKKKELIISLILLMIISIVNNYYAASLNNLYHLYFIKQLVWYILGFISIFIISKINLDYLFDKILYIYILGNLLLILTLIIGVNVNGSTSWINLGFFSFQPTEFMKICLILLLRKISLNKNYSDFKYLFICFIIVLIPSILTFLEQDTGPIIIYLIIFLTFIFMKKINKFYYIGGISLLLLISVSFFILYFNYQDFFIQIFGNKFFYRMDRITNLINGKGYQIKQALLSISSSGLFGIKKRIYFPEAPTDFAFTLLISNFGFIGMMVFLIIYFYFFYSLSTFKDRYLLYPIYYILLIEYSINILMNIGLFPIIGITLPLISYGGSSLLSFMILLGFILNKKSIS
jgi:rod shape determining protein RodA